MKKISVKQLLVNAMKEYGNNLILSERIWSRHRDLRGHSIKIDLQQLTSGGIYYEEYYDEEPGQVHGHLRGNAE